MAYEAASAVARAIDGLSKMRRTIVACRLSAKLRPTDLARYNGTILPDSRSTATALDLQPIDRDGHGCRTERNGTEKFTQLVIIGLG